MYKFCAGCFLIVLVTATDVTLSDDLTGLQLPENAVAVDDVYLRLIDSAEIPALERGQVSDFLIEMGDNVDKGQVVASLDSAEAEMNLELAAIELKIAECQQEESVSVEAAGSALKEAEHLLEQAAAEARVAETVSKSQLGMRAAERNLKASSATLDRAVRSRERFATSVSDGEFDKITLARDQDQLKMEEAELDRVLNALRRQSREHIVKQQEAAVQRLGLALKKAKNDVLLDDLRIQGLQKSLQIKNLHLERRQIRAPFSGVIVERLRSPGEWVESGQPVLRIVRLDQLYAEGHIRADSLSVVNRGMIVLVRLKSPTGSIEVKGQIVFVSPEIDAVNQQVTVRAKVANVDRLLNPGQTAQMWLIP